MAQFFSRFSFDAVKPTSQILGLVLIIWLIVLGCAIFSIMSQPFTKRQRLFWMITIICLPCVGLLCYLPFSTNKETAAKLYRGKYNK